MKKCNGKDHGTKFCTTATQPEQKCTYCRKDKHTTENCKARKKAAKKAERESRASRTLLVAPTTASTASPGAPVQSMAQGFLGTSQGPPVHMLMQHTPIQTAGIEERLAHGGD